MHHIVTQLNAETGVPWCQPRSLAELFRGETYSTAGYYLPDLDDIGGDPRRADRAAHLRWMAGRTRAASIDHDGNLGRRISRIVQSVGLGVGADGGTAACPRSAEVDRSELQIESRWPPRKRRP
jgi:hypothetical protein